MPLGETIELELTAKDVIHSFWVPEWRVKQDVVPGTSQHIVVTPTKTGRFPIICTELCGIGHSTMRNWVNVVPPEEFEQWLKDQQAKGAAAAEEGAARPTARPSSPSKAVWAVTRSPTPVPPQRWARSLDMVLPGQSEEFVRESIVDPDAQIAEGYQPGVMPSNFGDTLSDEQLDALVKYLLEVAGKQG